MFKEIKEELNKWIAHIHEMKHLRWKDVGLTSGVGKIPKERRHATPSVLPGGNPMDRSPVDYNCMGSQKKPEIDLVTKPQIDLQIQCDSYKTSFLQKLTNVILKFIQKCNKPHKSQK